MRKQCIKGPLRQTIPSAIVSKLIGTMVFALTIVERARSFVRYIRHR